MVDKMQQCKILILVAIIITVDDQQGEIRQLKDFQYGPVVEVDKRHCPK